MLPFHSRRSSGRFAAHKEWIAPAVMPGKSSLSWSGQTCSRVTGRPPQKMHTRAMPKDQPDEQYTPRGERVPIPKRSEFDANLDKLLKAPAPPKRVLGVRRRKQASPLDK